MFRLLALHWCRGSCRYCKENIILSTECTVQGEGGGVMRTATIKQLEIEATLTLTQTSNEWRCPTCSASSHERSPVSPLWWQSKSIRHSTKTFSKTKSSLPNVRSNVLQWELSIDGCMGHIIHTTRYIKHSMGYTKQSVGYIKHSKR